MGKVIVFQDQILAIRNMQMFRKFTLNVSYVKFVHFALGISNKQCIF